MPIARILITLIIILMELPWKPPPILTAMMIIFRQMHETTKVFNTHGVVVQRMIDKVIKMLMHMVKAGPKGSGGSMAS